MVKEGDYTTQRVLFVAKVDYVKAGNSYRYQLKEKREKDELYNKGEWFPEKDLEFPD